MALDKFYFGEDTKSKSYIDKLNKVVETLNKFENMKVHGATLKKTPSSHILIFNKVK